MIVLVLVIVLVANLDDLRVRWSELGWLARGLSLAGVAVIAVGLYFAAPEQPVVEKALGRLAMPAGIVWFGWMVAAIVLVRRSPRLGWLSAFGWLLFSLSGNEYLGASLLESLEEEYAQISPAEQEAFDAVFVLGGGALPTSSGFGELGESGDRVMLGARLYHTGLAPVLVTSGASVPGMGDPFESGEITEQIWWSVGVDPDAIVVVRDAYNTSLEMDAYKTLADERGWRRMGLVTSAWHMRRALGLAQERGLELEPLPADRRGFPAWTGVPSVIPVGGGFEAVHIAMWERLGAVLGR